MCQSCISHSDDIVASARSALHAHDLTPSQRHRYEAIDSLAKAQCSIQMLMDDEILSIHTEVWSDAVDSITQMILTI